MSAAPASFRLGAHFLAQIAQAGGSQSAAARAYLLLGFAAAGVAMAPWRREIARCLAEDLAPEVLDALRAIDIRSPAASAEPSLPFLPPPDDSDPLLSVGFRV